MRILDLWLRGLNKPQSFHTGRCWLKLYMLCLQSALYKKNFLLTTSLINVTCVVEAMTLQFLDFRDNSSEPPIILRWIIGSIEMLVPCPTC